MELILMTAFVVVSIIVPIAFVGLFGKVVELFSKYRDIK